ncbi:TetR/AcrR family transcriptional regulator [Streptomyces fulvoviolaceus]|uniref:TetR/AcrR family transcriptional regulator n=1 Tax=Streptomyces fulvoviolaceus TaxID=285535 RepID=UPI0004C877A6|nr:TetR/AcrR family transcriptional regulator [Streptomyces fulvoviolaceus]MCT9084439.1 TetR/AcrR family transcriptional regulator [Streptomyces fulvoviolaceus]
MVRMSAEERRESVIRAATAEFARGGYYGTSTEAIAKRVGVSQPYLFRLFPGKKAMFLAAAERCVEDTIRTFEEAAKGLEGEEALHAMANAYTKVIAERPERLMMQMQMYVAVAAAEEAGEHEFGESVRAGWMRLWDTVHLPLGADVNETTTFLAYGMLINCLVAMGFPPGHRVWEGLYPSARIKGRLEH